MNLDIPHTITSYRYKKKENKLSIFIDGTQLYKGKSFPQWHLQYGVYPSPLITISGLCLEDLLIQINELLFSEYFHDCDLEYLFPKK